VAVLTILALGVWAFVSLIEYRRALTSADIDRMLEPPVQWNQDAGVWEAGEDMGDSMPMDLLECEDGDYLFFARNSNGRLILTCKAGEGEDDVSNVDQ